MTSLAQSVTVPSLVRWGVSADADLVYRTLVSFGARESGAVAKDLGLSAARVRHALDELSAIGAAVRRISATAAAQLWHAAPPGQVVEQVRRRRMRAGGPVDPVARYAQVLRDAGVDAGSAVTPSARVTFLGGVTAARQRIAALTGSARHEHLSIHPEPVFSSASVAETSDRAALGRGLRISTVCLPPVDGDAYHDEMRDGGVHSRFAMSLPLLVMVFDRSRAIVPADPLDRGKGALEIADPASVECLVALFRREWSAGWDPERGGVRPIVLSRREEQLIQLLAAGLTDDVAARRLKISPRTVTTLVRGLMDRLSVENRFQLGLALGARAAELPGLLPAPEPVRPLASSA
jgi:DNA-binding CsgD family transcriptional regulator